ncbi:MAG: pseudaminic acid biosynthesis-associated methylase [Leptolyngbyaceae bacterium]|nr:pseudaminic acid biosynthesis-associated methylase [Leptolyngbyaceae bacterium]
MSDKSTFKTEQEDFWAGNFGSEYINRNKSNQLLASNLNFFSKALRGAAQLRSCLEFGANIGMNLKALKLLYPALELSAVEINAEAVSELSRSVPKNKIFLGSILDFKAEKQADLVLIKGVLIHINPDELAHVYDKLVQASYRYILVAEYYNPAPVAIPYRGHLDRLFKRDFAGEIMDRYPSVRLLDYGFCYHRDPSFPQDDITWFLMEKG